jgi:hypothetical protein
MLDPSVERLFIANLTVRFGTVARSETSGLEHREDTTSGRNPPRPELRVVARRLQ